MAHGKPETGRHRSLGFRAQTTSGRQSGGYIVSIWGKVIGGVAGFALGGPLGALLGAVAGHSVDQMKEAEASMHLSLIHI